MYVNNENQSVMRGQHCCIRFLKGRMSSAQVLFLNTEWKREGKDKSELESEREGFIF